MSIIIGIDATNLRHGGGRTHLIEMLNSAYPTDQSISRIVVWGSKETLSLLHERSWLYKKNPPELENGIVRRTIWQRSKLSAEARKMGINILFVPGGSYAGDFHPIVTMSQNMLPFEIKEIYRFRLSVTTIRLLLLRYTQIRSFKNAEGMIFLTAHAKNIINNLIPSLDSSNPIIPHGINKRFFIKPRPQLHISNYSFASPYRILYVSIINQYKHQWNVIEAVAMLRKKYNWPLVLDLVGPSYQPALKRLEQSIKKCDPNKQWVNYIGAVPFDELHKMYSTADLGVFASSCENMPIILLEKMAAGLPIACSDRGPMPEILSEAGLYFDPEKINSIILSLHKLIESPEIRSVLAHLSYKTAQKYTWELCANSTLKYINEVHGKYISLKTKK